jgi:hypothetical protein
MSFDIAHRRGLLAGSLVLLVLACASCTHAPPVKEKAASIPKPTPAAPEPVPAPKQATPPPRPAAATKPTPAKPSPPRQAAAPKPASPPVATAAAPAASRPPLDLKSLEQRLKETNAIGVMTKLSLKNQVDDLVGQFRDFYDGRLRASLADLRRPFDLLLMKVLSLLQDSDPALARDIHDSRDALWALLSDPERFRKLST